MDHHGDTLEHIAEALRPLAVPIDTLVADPANARTHGPENLDAIAGSLHVYGQRKPVVARRDNGVVIAGNGTLAAARSLGWTHLAAVFVDDDAATAAGYAVADNRTAELAGWDKDALGLLLRDVATGCDPRLDAMLTALADDLGIIPPEEIPWPEIGATVTHTLTLRYSAEDESAIKRFIGREVGGPLDPNRTGRLVLERIKELAAAGPGTESGGEEAA